MKVFLISNMYPSEQNPRYGIFVKRFESEMSARGITFSKSIMTAKYDKPAHIKLYFYVKLYFDILIKGLRLKKDMIYVHFPSHTSPALIILKLFTNKPIVLNFHGVDAISETKEQKIFRFFLIPLIRKTSFFVVPSEYYRKVISDEFKAPEKNIYVYPSGGIDQSIFRKYDFDEIFKAKQSFDIKEDEIVLGFVSSFIKEKGWPYFVDLVSHFNRSNTKIKAIMIGGGKEIEEVDKKIKNLNLQDKIMRLDAVKQDSLPLYYNLMDIFIFPTISKTESLGLVGLEALACGIPVIASDIGGPSGYIKHDYNGMLFEPGNLKDLINKTNTFIGLKRENRLELKKNAIDSVKKYEKTKVNHELYRILVQLNTSQ